MHKSETYYVYRDQDRTLRALGWFISEFRKIPFSSAMDLIEEAQKICDIVYETKSYMGFVSIEQVIDEYLGLTDTYADLFKPH